MGHLIAVDYPAGAGKAGNGAHLGPITYEAHGKTASLRWLARDGSTAASESVTYDSDGRQSDGSINGVDANPAGPNYSYDSVGRLVTAWSDQHKYQYEYAASGCGSLPSAGKNSNRTKLMTDGVVTATYCYDPADRVISSTGPGASGSIVYDAYGDVASVGSQTYSYDSSGRHVRTAAPGVVVDYTRDATNRLKARSVNSVTSGAYVYGDASDRPVATLDQAGAVSERVNQLLGGAMVTRRAGSEVWSLPNMRGDVASTLDQAGSVITQHSYSPFGGSASVPDSNAGELDAGWLGAQQRPTEHQSGLSPIVELGARAYDPKLGRFLQPDPIEGGSANDYDYANADPVQGIDLDGAAPSYPGKSPALGQSGAYGRISQYTHYWGGSHTPERGVAICYSDGDTFYLTSQCWTYKWSWELTSTIVVRFIAQLRVQQDQRETGQQWLIQDCIGGGFASICWPPHAENIFEKTTYLRYRYYLAGVRIHARDFWKIMGFCLYIGGC